MRGDFAGSGPEDSWINVRPSALAHPRWAAIHGRHHVPTIGTLVHRKRWYSGRVRVRFLPEGGTDWLPGQTDWATLGQLITAGTLAEARTLVALIVTDGRP